MSTALAPAPKTGGPRYTGPGGRQMVATELQRMVTYGRQTSERNRNRWMENRAMFRGDQWLTVNVSTNAIRLMASDNYLRSGRRRDTINRILPFVEGRIALYAVERPPFEVIPAGTDERAVDGARQAEKLIDAMWGESGWDVKSKIPELARAGEIDGISFLYVGWNPSKGPAANQPIAVTPEGPVTDPAMLNALQEMDPDGQALWKWVYPEKPLGDVEWRVVRPGALSVDPLAVSNFNDARWVIESRVIGRDEAERLAGRPLKGLIEQSDGMLNRVGDNSELPDVNVDDGENSTDRRMSGSVIVHELFRIPGGDWPDGAHIVWLDRAPAVPLVEREWKDDLPYRAFTPRPDGGHFFNCRGTVDHLKPVQRRYNRTLSLLHEWLDRVGRPPLFVYKGSVAGQSIYNERGFTELNPGFQEPHYFNAPGEPAAVLTTHLQWMEQQMAEIAAQPGVSRGQAPGSGVESAAGLQLLIQQTEQQLSSSTAELVGVYEWACSRALKLVHKNYILPRAVNAPGVSDSLEFLSFTGEMLAGAHRFKVTGSLQPATRAAEMQGLMQLAPIIGQDIRPYVSRLIGGDTADFKRADEAQRKRQQRKNRLIAMILTQEKAQAVFENFEKDKARFANALQVAAQQAQQLTAAQQPTPDMVGSDGMPLPPPPPVSPMDVLAQRGISPPMLLDSLQQAGVTVPTVEDQDDPMQQMAVLNLWRVSEEFERMPPLVHQVAREYGMKLQEKMASQLTAMGAQDPSLPAPGEGPGPQQGSAPAPKGTPSPPKAPGQPAGTPPARMPTGG